MDCYTNTIVSSSSVHVDVYHHPSILFHLKLAKKCLILYDELCIVVVYNPVHQHPLGEHDILGAQRIIFFEDAIITFYKMLVYLNMKVEACNF